MAAVPSNWSLAVHVQRGSCHTEPEQDSENLCYHCSSADYSDFQLPQQVWDMHTYIVPRCKYAIWIIPGALGVDDFFLFLEWQVFCKETNFLSFVTFLKVAFYYYPLDGRAQATLGHMYKKAGGFTRRTLHRNRCICSYTSASLHCSIMSAKYFGKIRWHSPNAAAGVKDHC